MITNYFPNSHPKDSVERELRYSKAIGIVGSATLSSNSASSVEVDVKIQKQTLTQDNTKGRNVMKTQTTSTLNATAKAKINMRNVLNTTLLVALSWGAVSPYTLIHGPKI